MWTRASQTNVALLCLTASACAGVDGAQAPWDSTEQQSLASSHASGSLAGGSLAQASTTRPTTTTPMATTAAAPASTASPSGLDKLDSSELGRSVRPNLQWKRAAAFRNDLARALDLDEAALCEEFDVASCVDAVHLVALGGNDPFDQALWQPADEPLATTSLAVDRVIVKACDKRVRMDSEAGRSQRVLPLADHAGAAPAPDSPEATTLITELYHRLLGRDPDASEVALVARLTRDDAGASVSGGVFACSACYAIASTTEFIFF